MIEKDIGYQYNILIIELIGLIIVQMEIYQLTYDGIHRIRCCISTNICHGNHGKFSVRCEPSDCEIKSVTSGMCKCTAH